MAPTFTSCILSMWNPLIPKTRLHGRITGVASAQLPGAEMFGGRNSIPRRARTPASNSCATSSRPEKFGDSLCLRVLAVKTRPNAPRRREESVVKNDCEMDFELIPAIDLKGGKCVRLQEGDAARSTEYSDDPAATALFWQEQGATRLHLVDLDGAFSGEARHFEAVRAIFRALEIPVQFGGGVRTLDHIERLLDSGADRVILGTIAVEHPEIVEEAVR